MKPFKFILFFLICSPLIRAQGAIRNNNNPSATNCGKAICEGNTRWYNKNGSLSSVSNYLEGREHGKSIIYLKSGKTIELNYDKGKIQKKND